MLPGQDCGVRCGRRVPHLTCSVLARGLCCLGQTAASDVGVASPTLRRLGSGAACEGLMLPGQDCSVRCGRRVPHLTSSLRARGLCCQGQTAASDVGVASPTLRRSGSGVACEGLMLPGQDCGVRCGRRVPHLMSSASAGDLFYLYYIVAHHPCHYLVY
jgi:hypothetical protein